MKTNQDKITHEKEETLSIKALCKDKEYSNKDITIIVEEEALLRKDLEAAGIIKGLGSMF